MYFMSRFVGYTLSGNKKCEEIMTELQIPQITLFIEQYRINWKGFNGGRALIEMQKKFLKYR
jgi:hypothetical protein